MGNYQQFNNWCGGDTRPPSLIRQPNEEQIFDHCLEQLCSKGGLTNQEARKIKQAFFSTNNDQHVFDFTYMLIFTKRKIFLGQCIANQIEQKWDLRGQAMVSCYDKNKFYKGSFEGNLPCEGKLTFDFNNNYPQEQKKQQHEFQFEGRWVKEMGSTQSQILQSFCGNIKIDNSQKIVTPVNLTWQMLKNCKFIQYHNLDVYVGQVQMSNGKMLAHGFGKYVYRNLTQNNYPYYQGQFRQGLRHGHGRMYMNQQKCLQITWENGKPHGVGQYIINSTVYPVVYQHGRRIETNPSDIT